VAGGAHKIIRRRHPTSRAVGACGAKNIAKKSQTINKIRQLKPAQNIGEHRAGGEAKKRAEKKQTTPADRTNHKNRSGKKIRDTRINARATTKAHGPLYRSIFKPSKPSQTTPHNNFHTKNFNTRSGHSLNYRPGSWTISPDHSTHFRKHASGRKKREEDQKPPERHVRFMPTSPPPSRG
jgi:hypothetical protein